MRFLCLFSFILIFNNIILAQDEIVGHRAAIEGTQEDDMIDSTQIELELKKKEQKEEELLISKQVEIDKKRKEMEIKELMIKNQEKKLKMQKTKMLIYTGIIILLFLAIILIIRSRLRRNKAINT